jgi:hypothetical protein
MRKVLLAGVLFVALPSSSTAAPCVLGTLADYIALGAGGCTAGGATFADFTASTLLAGAMPIAPAAVTVTPIGGGVGLDFGVIRAALADELFDVLIRYSVSGLSIGAALMSMAGSAATDDGVVTGVEDVCVGGTFAAPVSGCSGTPVSLIVAQIDPDLISPDSDTFPVNSFFDVFTEITIDGGIIGTASLNGFVRNQFTPVAVPEPITALLIGSGVVALAVRGRRG